MLKYIITKTISIILTAVISLVSCFGLVPKTTQQENLGATIPITVALFETSLATKITSSATTMTLTSGTNKDGNSLSGTYGFVIDEGTASEEFVSASCTATACSSMSRGLSVVTGNTEISALKKSHRRGASVKISNHPQLAIISRIMNGDEEFPNDLTFKGFSESSGKLTYDSAPTFDDNEDIISKRYADALTIAGAPNASLTVKGIFEMATLAELLSGTATGTTGAYLSAPTSMFATTTSASNLIPVTDTDGLLDQGFLDLTEGFTFSGTNSFTGANSFTGIPTMSTTTPSNDEDVASKVYVDSFFFVENLTLSFFQILEARSEYPAVSNPSYLNDNTTTTQTSTDVVGEEIIVNFIRPRTIAQYRYWGHDTNNDDGYDKIQYQALNGTWADWETSIPTRGASFSSWDSTPDEVVAIAIKWVCTTLDSGNSNRIYELELKY